MQSDAWAQAQRRRRRVADAASGGSGEAPLMPLPSELRLAGSYKLEWLRQRRKESHLARERRARARASEQLQEFAQEFEPARLEFAPRWAWEHAGQAEARQAEAGRAGRMGQAEVGQAEVGQAEAGLLTQRREWEEVVCHRRQLSLNAQALERTDPERRVVVVFVVVKVSTERRVSSK